MDEKYLCLRVAFLFLVTLLYTKSITARAALSNSPETKRHFNESQDTQAVNLIDVVSIEKDFTGNTTNTFIIRCVKNAPGLLFFVYSFDGELVEIESSSETRQLTTIFFTCARSTMFKDIVFKVYSRDFAESMLFVVDNGGGEPASQNNFWVPSMALSLPGDLIYRPGEDANITVRCSTGGAVGTDHGPRLHQLLQALDLTSHKFSNFYGSNSIFDVRNSSLSQMVRKRVVTVKTSERPVSGRLDLTCSASGGWGRLVPEILVTKLVDIYPTSQSGPFPVGYVGFVERDTEHCTVGQMCELSCTAVGSTLTSISVREITKAGNLEDVPSQERSRGEYPHNLYLRWHARPSPEVSLPQTKRYKCDATDDAHGSMATQIVEIQLYGEVAIDEQSSNVTMEMSPERSSLILNCVVDGEPQPKIRFDLEYNLASEYGVRPDSLVRTGNLTVIASKVVTFTSQSLENHKHTSTPNYNTRNDDVMGDRGDDMTNKGRLLAADCTIDRPETYTYRRYHFELPDWD